MVTLRLHQNRAIKAMHENTKGQVIVPTGGGKTDYDSSRIAEVCEE